MSPGTRARFVRVRSITVVVTAVLSVVLNGCASAQPASLAPQPKVVEVEMKDNRFAYDPAIPTGRVIFRVANRDPVDHQLLLTRLPEDLLPLDEQLHSDVRRPLETLRSLPVYAPGESGAVALDLRPARYGLICFLTESGGSQSYALRGMNSEFVVR